jgi:hypothetical protein
MTCLAVQASTPSLTRWAPLKTNGRAVSPPWALIQACNAGGYDYMNTGMASRAVGRQSRPDWQKTAMT